ncbi:MAG: PH domain-containing protein [Ornithinimicrobium sp.]
MLGSSEISESGVKVSSRILQRYVLRGEQVEVATRQHWASLTEPVFTVLVTFVFISWISSGLERAFGEFGLYLWWVWFALIIRMLWKMLEWRNEWFVATDKRLLLTYGLITHKVAMMPLGKVTDMTYGRSITGRFIGYGTFVLESAGQDQALQKINWVPAPDETYREICDIIFGPDQPFDSEDRVAADKHARPRSRAGRDERPQEYEAFADQDDDGHHDEGHHDDGHDDGSRDDHHEADYQQPDEDDTGDHEAEARGVDSRTDADADADAAGWATSTESASTYQVVRPRPR